MNALPPPPPAGRGSLAVPLEELRSAAREPRRVLRAMDPAIPRKSHAASCERWTLPSPSATSRRSVRTMARLSRRFPTRDRDGPGLGVPGRRNRLPPSHANALRGRRGRARAQVPHLIEAPQRIPERAAPDTSHAVRTVDATNESPDSAESVATAVDPVPPEEPAHPAASTRPRTSRVLHRSPSHRPSSAQPHPPGSPNAAPSELDWPTEVPVGLPRFSPGGIQRRPPQRLQPPPRESAR